MRLPETPPYVRVLDPPLLERQGRRLVRPEYALMHAGDLLDSRLTDTFELV
jgi:hypothetical protein